MEDQCDLQAEIIGVEAKIRVLESKEERLEAALEGNGSYFGTVDHVRIDPPPPCHIDWRAFAISNKRGG